MTTNVLDKEIVFDRDRLDELTLEFNRRHLTKSFQQVAVAGASLGVGGAVLAAGSAHATTAGADAAAAIAGGVANAIVMIEGIDGIALAAFGVALAPMGFMMTLRVLNMVLSRV